MSVALGSFLFLCELRGQLMNKCKNKLLSCLGAWQVFVKHPKKKSIQPSILFEDDGPVTFVFFFHAFARFSRQILGVVDVTLIGVPT